MRSATSTTRAGALHSMTPRTCFVLSIVVGALLVPPLIACTAPTPSGFKSLRTANGTNDETDDSDDDLKAGNDQDRDEESPTTPTTPTGPTTTSPDRDNDGIPDSEDCDPTSATLAGTQLLKDPLTADNGFFTTAEGFPQASWVYDGTAYRQQRLGDVSDTVIFNRDPSIGDTLIEIRSASTEITGTISPTLRQMFVLMGATVTGGSLSAVGCGVEVVSGEAVTQKTSIVRLAGQPGAVTTTPLRRVDRGALQVNEEFSIRAHLVNGKLTCDVTQTGAIVTTATANVGTVKGAVGLFTRQTKALFKNASICKLK